MAITSCFIMKNVGERLRDHWKKAIESERETEDQLKMLLEKLNETGLVFTSQ